MTETLHGLCRGVRAEVLGSQLRLGVIAGLTSIPVVDAGAFNPAGGWLRLAGLVIAEYTSADPDDTDTLQLAVPLALPVGVVGFEEGERVDVWDASNAQPAMRYVASVDHIDGFDGRPVDVVVDQGVAHVLSTSMRDDTGESVTLVRDGAGLRITQVDGRQFALAAVQYLQAGLTTRQAEDEAGIDLLGSFGDATPGLFAYGVGGNPTVIVDALTGDASFIGELGTALPGDPGVFMYSPTFSGLGAQVTHPTIQLNTGATRDQPSIQADTVGGGAGLYLYSGASTAGRESHQVIDQGAITFAIERTADSDPDFGSTMALTDSAFSVGIHAGAGTGGSILLENNLLIAQTDYAMGPSNLAAVLIGLSTIFQVGYRDNSDGSVQGMWLTRAGDVVLSTSGAVDVQNPAATAFKAINASAFNVSSDRRVKRDLRPGAGGLEVLRAAPTYRFRYDNVEDDRPRLGPLAEDLPDWTRTTLGANSPHAGTEAVDLHALVGLLWQAVRELTDEVDQLKEHR